MKLNAPIGPEEENHKYIETLLPYFVPKSVFTHKKCFVLFPFSANLPV